MNNKKNKGFTLIELLGVIVVLAALALIVMPIISNVLKSAGKSTFRQSVNNIIDSADIYINTRRTIKYSGPIDYPVIFECNGYNCQNKEGESLDFERSVPVSGKIIIASDGIVASMVSNGTYCAYGKKLKLEISSRCNVLDHTDPIIDESKDLTVTATTNSIIVTVPNNLMHDEETGIQEYKVTLYKGNTKISEKTYEAPSISFTDLTSNTEYKITVVGINGNNGSATIEKTVWTHGIINPTLAYVNTPASAVNDYLKSQTVNVTYNNSNVTAPKYFVKSTRDASVNANTVESCGSGDKPGTCVTTSTKNISANIWYRVSGNINVTYNQTATSTATIYAVTYDGTNYSGAAAKTVSKIDATKPTVTLGTATSKTNSLTISYTLNDAHSGVGSYTCKYSDVSGNYAYNGNATQTGCTITGLTNNKTYYYQVCVIDGVGNAGDCKTGSTGTAQFTNPTIVYENTPSTPVNDYLKQQVAKITFSNSNVSNPTYYIKTTRAATASANTVASCGTGTNPGTCTAGAATTLAANTWYKVNGNINVIYNQTATSTATIYAITYDGNNFSGATTKTISKIDAAKPTVTLGTVTSKTNSLTINYTLADSNSGIGSYTCKYSDTANTYITNGNAVTDSSCTLTGLTNNKTYYYQVCVTDGVGNVGDCKTGSTGTAQFTNPTIAYENTPSTPVNDYLKQQVAKVTFSNSNVNNPTYYIKTTRAATASANTIDSCGNGDNPGTCTATSTKNLSANIWYRVSGNIDVTYNETATSTATIYAITYDGNNFSGATTKTISKIDAVKPTVTLGTVTSKTNSLTINYTLADSNSGIGSYTCKYSDTANTYTTNGNSITSSACTITGLTNNKTYYYQVCVVDGVGNAGDCKTGSTGTAQFTNPTIAYENTPSTPVNDYLKQQVAKVTFSNSNVTSATYYIKTTRTGTASANTVASCGTDTNPGTCTASTVTALVANTWYKVSGNINVTYNATATSTATIYAITYDGNNFSGSTSKTISKIDATKPTVTLGTVTPKTNSLTINYTLADSHSGVGSYTCKYSDTANTYTTNGNSITTSACTITGLTNNKTYYYQVCVVDGVGNAGDCKTGSTGTAQFTNPTIAYENTPSTAVNDYLKSQVAKVTFSNSNVTSATYYIKTTRAGTASANTTQACGTGDKPGTCSNSAVTALAANTWYKVSGNINVTYNATATSTATIYAITYDGTNFSGATSKTISKIDATKPTVTLGTTSSKTNSLEINYTLADSNSGVGSYTCKYSDTSGSYTTNGNTATESKCTITGLTNNKTYYYQVCVTDGVGNAGDCKTGSTATANFANPTIAYENTPTTAVNDYLKSQVAKVTFSNSNVTSATYYIKTTRAATASTNTVQACGTGDKPGSCSNSAVTSLVANTWYKVSGNINVTYNATATSIATIYAITYDGNNFSGSTSKTISKIDATKPTVTLGTVTPKTNSLEINYTLADANSGVGSYTCKYSATSGSYTTNGNTVTDSKCTITGLANNKTYYYQVCVTDGVGNAGDCKTGSTATAQFTNPTIAYENTPTTAVNDYLKSQVAKVTFSNSNVSNPTYYIKTTRAATASANTVASCGTADTPGSCSNSAVTSLVANTWYKVNGNINVTYNQTATSTATIYAITYDGTNFSGATSKTISKIDAEKPTVTLGTTTSKTNSLEINYTLADSYSGVGSYSCKYSATSGSYTTNGNTITTSKCTITGLTNNKTYYYQVCVTDGVGNAGDCKTGSTATANFTNPTITYANTPTTAVSDYLKQQVAKVTFSNSNVTSATYYIKTTRTGTASANTVASCGTGTNPGTCTTAATKSLAADTWYKVSGNIDVTYSATATSTATIYAITYDGNNFSGATSKTISKIDAEKPTVTLGAVTAKTNSLTINYTLADAKTGIGSYTCKYSDTSGSYTTNGNSITTSACTLTGLTNNKTYYYQVCVTDGVGNAGDCKTGSTATAQFTNPTIAYENTPTTAVSDYLKQQVAQISFSNSNVSNPTYYIKTTRAGTASANTVATCGTGTNPGSCSNSAVTALAANTWYKVSGNINVTYNQTATSTATIYAITYDGNNFSGSTSKTVSKIDAEKPAVTLGTTTSKTNSLTINYTLADAKTGIGSYTCKYSATSGSYTTNGNSITDSKCTITGLTNNKTYYYQICATDGVGNAGDCKTGSTATANFTNPTITYANTPTTAVNDYLKQQVAQISFSNSNVSNPTYYIKTTRTGTASANTVQACGTGTNPGSCSNSAVTALVADTWYRVSGNINVTYNQTATSTATIYAITYDGNNFSGSTSKTISKIDAEKPAVTLGTTTSKTNSLTINYTLADAKTGIGSYTCKYSATSGSYTTNGNTVNTTSCTITGLANNKTYYYQVCATDGVGNAGDCKTGSTATANFTNPTITYANTPTTAVNDYLKQQVAQISFSNSNVSNPTYYIKTTRTGTASANTVQSCGTGDKPGTCGTNATTALVADTWYRVSGNINVTYNQTATSTATIYAITYDGNNFSGSTSKTISKIDAEKPAVTLGTTTSKTNSLTINYTLADAKTGIGSYTCKYSATSGSYTTNGNTVTDSSCTITGLANNKTYYYQVCATDGVGNAGDCKTGSATTANFTNPTMTYTNTPTTDVNDYLRSQTVNITFSNSNVSSAQYFIKTTRAGVASANTVQSCGTGDTPTGCSNSAVTSLVANTWYKVSGNINVTYNATATSTATIYAITFDGNNYSGSTSKTVSKIDAEKPTVTLGTATSTSNSVVINYTLADAKTGIGSYTCKYSDTSGSYTTNGNSITTSACTLTGLTKNKTYYYQICTTDGVGNTGDCKTGSKATTDITAPTITYTNTPSTAVNDYLRSQTLNVTFSSTNVSSPTYYIKTTRAGTTNSNTVASCGTGTNPGTCSNSAVTSLAVNTWYKVSGNINVTYSAAATSTATLTAITYDGTNYSGSTSKTVSKIEGTPTAPTITGGTGASATSNTDVTIRVSTAGTASSGVKTYDYYKSTSSTAPGASTTRTGYTSGNLTVSDEGTTYVWYRTRSNLDKVSSWTGPQVVNIVTACTFTSKDFAYTGGVQTWTVPANCDGTYLLEVCAGAGGEYNAGTGGKGGCSSGYANLTSGQTLNIVVGGAGTSCSTGSCNGGYNGGGTAIAKTQSGGSGGGATHIAKTGGSYTTLASYGNATTAANYLYIVAGGGGGAGDASGTTGYGGNGGGTSGNTGICSNSTYTTYGGTGATQNAGGTKQSGYVCTSSGLTYTGSFGQGGASADSGCGGNGGGGGYYGGGGSVRGHNGAGGGSGWIGGVTGGTTTAGVQSGNGKAKITKFDRIAKIPTMTSNTAPSGVASGSSVASSYYQHYFPFCGGSCFNNTITNAWVPSESDNSPYVQYKFTSATVAKVAAVNLVNTLAKSSAPTYNIEGSNDGTNWTILANRTATVGEIYISLSSTQAYLYYRIHFDQKINNSSTVGTWRVYSFQLYN